MNNTDAKRLRLSYEMPTHKGMKALIGWDGDIGTYWFAIVKVSMGQSMRPDPIDFEDVFYAGGDELDRIKSVAELVRRTWGEIYWQEAEPKVLHLLRNDPIVEDIREAVGNDEPYPADVEDYILDTLSSFETDPTKAPAAARPSQPAEHRGGGFFKRRQ
jgi:hypothetical protein